MTLSQPVMMDKICVYRQMKKIIHILHCHLPCSLVLFFIFFFFFFNCDAERCNPGDKATLLKIKQHFNNPDYLATWDTTTDCCSWYIVGCNINNSRINALEFFRTNISGQIPAAVGDLPYLEFVTFRKLSGFTGTIPQSITKLSKLKTLRISWTNLSGPIPSFLGELDNLSVLDLSYNNFSGSIPASLSLLNKLTGLRLDRNKLSGSIPEAFGNLTPSLQYLFLSFNQLSGTIPRSWGALNFTYMELQRNRLEGDISFLLGKNKTIEIMYFSRNLFQFDISNLEFPVSLGTFNLNHNRITGSLPEDLAKFDQIFLNVSYNRLCGRIPSSRRLQELGYTSFFHNKCLCGSPLPECK